MQYFTAIIICAPQPVSGKTALKYRNIKNDERSLQKFLRFASKFPGVHHINFYDKYTKKFIQQLRYDPPQKTTA